MATRALRLSVLDQSPIPEGATGADGPPGSVRARLQQIAAEYDADELVVLTMTHEHAARRRSYELVAEEFGLR